jgi:hypothetical protein
MRASEESTGERGEHRINNDGKQEGSAAGQMGERTAQRAPWNYPRTPVAKGSTHWYGRIGLSAHAKRKVSACRYAPPACIQTELADESHIAGHHLLQRSFELSQLT